MPESWSDERMIVALEALRDELLVPDAPLSLPSRRNRQPRGRALLVAAAVLLLAVVSVLIVAPAREAVADWLGLGSTEVRIEPDGTTVPLAALPTLADGARVARAAEAAAELGRALPTVTRADTDAAPAYAIPVEGGVLVRWPGRDETLWIHAVTDESVGYFKKFATPDAAIEDVDGVGDAALWLGGAHVLETPGRALAAQNVLLWLDDGLEWRLEGDLGRDEMVAIARALG
jgi:hypothetical protein